MAVLGLHCCAQAFSSCGKQGPPSNLSVWVSHCSGSSCCGAQAPGLAGFSSCSMWAQQLCTDSAAPRHVGLPDQGSNLCSLHYKADT